MSNEVTVTLEVTVTSFCLTEPSTNEKPRILELDVIQSLIRGLFVNGFFVTKVRWSNENRRSGWNSLDRP